MDLRIFMEWDRESGLDLQAMYPIQEGIEEALKEKEYGSSIKQILVVLICRPYDFKQRKRFKKDSGVLSYDILIDFYLVKNVELQEKKKLIRYQMVKMTEQAFEKYKWQNFDASKFLSDFKNAVNSVQW